MGLAVTKVNGKRRGPIKDTSVRKRSKPTLSKEYQTVFETTGKAMVIVEEDATISLTNAEFEKLSGYTKKEIEGKKSWTEFVAKDDRRRVREYHRLRKTDPMLAPRSFEFQLLDRHETVKNVVLTIGQIPGTNKSMASLLDITDRRQDEKQARGAHTASEERLNSKTAELIEANEALQAEVADLKRKVKKVEESEKLYRNLVENVAFGINLIDADFNIVMANSEQNKRMLKSVSELVGKKCFREFEKRDAVCPHCPGIQTMATGQPAEAETEAVRDDGSRFHVRIQTFPIFGQDSTMNGFIEVVEDITKRKQMEEELQRNEERFRQLVETMNVGLSGIDENGIITYANERLSEIWGYPVDEIIGHSTLDFLDEENLKIVKEQLARRKKGEYGSYEISWTRKDGKKVPTILSPTPRFDADGQFIGSYGFITDITERKRTEDALKESEERFRMLAENTPFAISVMAPDKTFEYFNPRFTELFGYTKEDLPDKDTWFKKAYPDEEYRKKVTSTWKRDIAEDVRLGEEDPRVFTVRCKDGQDKIISFKIVYLNDGKQYLTYRDITDRVNAEETLRESEERYRTLVENIKLGINLIDPDYNIIMVNAALSKKLKKQASEMVGKKCYREFLNRDAMCPNCPGVQAMATGKAAEDKIEGVRDNGRPFYMRLQAFPVFGQDGTVNGFIEIAEDITKRKQTEDALRESEERYRTLAENIKLGINLIDSDYNVIMVNAALSKRLNKQASEMVGKKCYREFLNRDAMCPNCPGVQAMATGKPAEDKMEGVRDDGNPFYMRLQAFPVFGQDGTVNGFIEVVEDITKRKQMEEKLRESEERFRRLIETTKVGVSVIDEKGVITYVNNRFGEIWGYSVDEIIGHHVSDFLDEDNQKILKAHLAKRKQGESDSYEISWNRKDGTKAPTILSPTPNFDANGKFIGSYGFITDITERKRIEEDLRRLASFPVQNPNPIIEITLTGKIDYINPAAKERLPDLYGAGLEHPVLRGIEPIIAEFQQGELKPFMREISLGNNIYEQKIFPVPETNFLRIILYEITERKKTQERLERYAAELERSNEEVKNFAYIVSHDLRVPLVNLKGYTSELQSALEVIGPNMDTALPHLDEEKRSAVAMALHEDVPEALEFITTSVSRMDSFINAVLQLSRFGRRDLKPEPIDMNALVQIHLDNLAHQIQERGIQVTIGSLPQVVADRTAMEQIMGNILGNAVKYLDSERPGQIEVTAEANNGEQIFRIRDNGRGIAEEDMHKVFAPFRRAGKQDTPGEGMGLAYVQTLVRRHNGRIWCESELGKGTTMTFTISPHRAGGGDHVEH